MWGVLVVVGIVLIILHNSAWSSAWVTAAALVFVGLVVASVAMRFSHRR
jgi:hypothetical protein